MSGCGSLRWARVGFDGLHTHKLWYKERHLYLDGELTTIDNRTHTIFNKYTLTMQYMYLLPQLSYMK